VIFFRGLPSFLSLITAALLFLASPGGGEWWPVVFVCLTPLLAVISRRKISFLHAFGAGLICGILHFMSQLYWLVTVLGHYGGLPWFLAWPGLFLLSFYMALFMALFFGAGAYILKKYPPLLSLFLLPGLWVGMDWLRGFLLTGFPWMDLGYFLYRTPEMLQVASLAGHHGITYLIVLVNSGLVLLFTNTGKGQKFGVAVAVVSLMSGAWYYSYNSYAEWEAELKSGFFKQTRIGIVQGNVDQSFKWSPAHQNKTVETYVDASSELVENDEPLSFVVWPETALPFYPQNSIHIEKVRELAATLGTGVLTGAPWYEVIDLSAKKLKFYNSAFFLDRKGNVGGTYFKSHLVPFGEYVPLKKYLPFISPLVEAVGDFSPGTIGSPLALGKARAGILICFESVFPELSRVWVQNGANVLVNLTNDAWYGKSSAPYHSLAMAVLRAVESRRMVVRSANTGISAFISPTGRIISQSEIFVPWAASESVALVEELSFWVRFGYLFAPLCFLSALLAVCGKIAGRKLRDMLKYNDRINTNSHTK